MEKIDTIDSNCPIWYGKNKFHYVVKRESYEVYRCTSVMKDQNDVLETLIDRFKSDSGVVRIFCNGVKIKVLNRLKIGRKPKYHWSNPS